MRIGHGYDVHKLVEGRDLIIGGVKIEHTLGLLGHSDADVLLHAVSDALLGAAGLGDIGKHFPDTDPQYKGADSLKLLQIVAQRVREAGYRVSNIDVTMIAQRPKLRPHIAQMEENIASAVGVDVSRINVKATTEERLGFTGEELGMDAEAMYGYFLRKLDKALTDTAETIDPDAEQWELAKLALTLALQSYAYQLACARILDILEPTAEEPQKKTKK